MVSESYTYTVDKIANGYVLILVLVEDGLGAVKGASFTTLPIGVLILVLVEDGLGVWHSWPQGK